MQPDPARRFRSVSPEETVSALRAWVTAKQPAAFVRFSEGEARLLCAEQGDNDSIRTACRKLRRQTGRAFSAAEMFHVKSDLLWALDNADIIGIVGTDDLPEAYKMWLSRVAAVACARAARRRETQLVASAFANREIFRALPLLLHGQRFVSAITCRDVKPVLERAYGVLDVRQFQLPSQFAKRAFDGEYEEKMHGTKIWPDIITQISESIFVREQGEVFLIGAGLFGKGLAIRIRNAGGIAVDLGSGMDFLVQKSTRSRGWELEVESVNRTLV